MTSLSTIVPPLVGEVALESAFNHSGGPSAVEAATSFGTLDWLFYLYMFFFVLTWLYLLL